MAIIPGRVPFIHGYIFIRPCADSCFVARSVSPPNVVYLAGLIPGERAQRAGRVGPAPGEDCPVPPAGRKGRSPLRGARAAANSIREIFN